MSTKPSSQPGSQGTRSRLFLPFLVLILAVFGAIVIWLIFLRPPEPVTFQYRDMVLEAKEGVPVSTLDPSSFSVDERGRVEYHAGETQARLGIDVSYYQEEIDWPAVAADGIQFAFLRLGYRGYSEGRLFLDERFRENLEGAQEAGVEIGIYFFSQAITAEEAVEEANFVLSTLAGTELDLPIAFDWEPIDPTKSPRTAGVTGEAMTACAEAFCRTIRERGYEAAVYLNQDQAYMEYDLSLLAGCPLWLADYRTATDFFYQCDFWQFLHTGTVNGIRTAVDLDLDLRPFHEEAD